MTIGGAGVLLTVDTLAPAGPGYWCLWEPRGFCLGCCGAVDRPVGSGQVLPRRHSDLVWRWILIGWEAITRGMEVPTVLLPPPSMIAERFASSTHILWDFQQTFLKAVLIGWVLGCGRLPARPVTSAVPAAGHPAGGQPRLRPTIRWARHGMWSASTAVQSGGGGHHDLLPMLVNTVTGLAQSGSMERDLMRTYAASWSQTLWSLRLPAAAPFIFNALKINSTLALIGAIVAEFFGTPIVGMGFRISTEVGRMNVDMVWAEIAVAAVAGTAFFGVLALIERAVTFWHPSVRG